MGKPKNKGKGGGGGKKNKHYRAPGGKKKQVTSFNETKKPEPPKNPFEIQVNKRKHNTLGRISKHEMGVPGVSRSRAIQKRKSTLLQEYKVRGKTNVVIDKRLGEKNKGMSEEDKIAKRSAFEKSRMFKKKSIFNLDDEADTLLTHKGQLLNEVDRYDDPRDVSDSDEDLLNEEFVNEANFGGFLKKKNNNEEVGEDGEPRSRDQIIAEMILESKKRKAEKAKDLDENYEKVQELDDEFKNPEFRNLLNMLNIPTKKQELETILQKNTEPSEVSIIPATASNTVKPPSSNEKNDYDRMLKELQFEKKTGLAGNRTKTNDETKKEEETEKAEKAENRRKQNHDKMVIILKAFNDIVIDDANSLAKAFDLCDITYEFLKGWKKYCPEVIIFLTNLLKSFDENQSKTIVQSGFVNARNVLRSHPCWIFNTLNQISKFVVLYKYLPSFYEVFSPILKLLQKWKLKLEEGQQQLSNSEQTVQLQTIFSKLIDSITSSNEKKEPIQIPLERPIAMKLYEPLIDDNFDGVRKRKSANKDKQTQERLAHKVKREMKSAIREIKKDNAFINRVVRKEEQLKDEERKRKVKELLGDLANQEGDYKKSKRAK